MVSTIRSWLKDKKFLLRLFSFLSAFFIVFWLGTVTAFAAEPEVPKDKDDREYYKITNTPNDGESKWPWPVDGLYNSLREALYSVNMSNLDNGFKLIDLVTDTAKDELKKTPQGYNSTIFNVVDVVAKKVIMPIATVILTYVVLLDFMQGVMEKNNFHDFDTSVFIRWIIKTTVAIYFVSNATTIANAFFDVGQKLANDLVTQTSSVTSGSLANGGIIEDMSYTLAQCGIGTLICILIPIVLLSVVSFVIYMAIYVIMIGRMIEIYLHLSVAPMPLATITNREFGETGKNYLKIIFAFVLQMFFILLCICIYKALVVNIGASIGTIKVGTENVLGKVSQELFKVLAYGVVLVLTMFKSNSLAKSILSAH